MIIIVRVQTKEGNGCVCDYVSNNLAELQEWLNGEARLICLSRRARHKDTSIFISVRNPDSNIVSNFITNKIGSIDGVDGIWMLNLLNPTFFAIPAGTSKDLSRYTITVRCYPRHLPAIYKSIAESAPTPNCVVTYTAYTFHLFGDCLQCSVLADSEETAQKFARKIEMMPGVLRTTVCQIEKTQRLVSNKEWQEYQSDKVTASQAESKETQRQLASSLAEILVPSF